MTVENTCPRCRAERPANSPVGLCPRCLLRLGLFAGPMAADPDVAGDPGRASGRINGGPPGPAVAPLEEISSSRASGVLAAHDATPGPLPRVPLLDGLADEARAVPTGDGGRFHLFGEIARGGMGVVFKGRDMDLGRDVALKVLNERYRDCPETVRRFVEEAQIGGQLQHPGIVPVYELGRLPDARLYIAMKLVQGRTLAALLAGRRNAADDLPRFLAIFEQVCQTMAYAHSCSVIHRDLKPSNVMVGNFGEVQVMDWGLAKVVDQGGVVHEERAPRSGDDGGVIRTARTGSGPDESRAGSVMGTPSYMAPEQARGLLDTLDERADVFGLGAILCEVLTGRPPYAGPAGEDLRGRAERADLAESLARLDASAAEGELVALARSCLAAAPKDRPRDAGVVAASLTSHLAGVRERMKAAELARARAEARADEEHKRRVLAVGLAVSLVAVVALVTGGAAWVARDRSARLEGATREVGAALRVAARLLERARAAPEGELAPWAEATQAAERAASLLGRGELGPDLRRQVMDLASAVSRERALAEAESRDRRMVERLAEIHADFAVHFDLRRVEEEYAAAFRNYGVDLDRLDPEEAGARLGSSPVAAELANALDQWTFLRRIPHNRDTAGAGRLVDVAKATDPDPWRNQLRDTLAETTTDRDRVLDSLRRLATTADAERLPEASVTRLAWALSSLGSREIAIELLRRTQRVHPDDFWVNSDLASELAKSGRPDEAVRFFSVALAIRPKSARARASLGDALRAAGRADEASAYPESEYHRDGPRRPAPNRGAGIGDRRGG